MSSYKTRAKNAIGSVKKSGGANYAQKQANNYNSKINSYGAYHSGRYAQMLENQMLDILDRRGTQHFGTDEVFSDYARDYSALSKLGAADAQTQVGDYMTGGYGNDYTAAASQQSYMNGLGGQTETLLDKISTAQQIHGGEHANAITGGELVNNMDAFNYQKWQDKLSALQNGRELWNAAYNAVNDVDRQAYADNQDYMLSLSKYYGDLEEARAQRKQDKWTADREYELDKLQYAQQKKAAKRTASGGSGRSKSSGSATYYTGVQSTGNKTGSSKESSKTSASDTYGLSKKEILALGYGPISREKLDQLIDSGEVSVYYDEKGKPHVKKRNTAPSKPSGKESPFKMGTKLV